MRKVASGCGRPSRVLAMLGFLVGACGGQIGGDVASQDDDAGPEGGASGAAGAAAGMGGTAGSGGRGGAAVSNGGAAVLNGGAGGAAGEGGQGGGVPITPDAGAGGSLMPDAGAPTGKPTFVVVGYAGRRIRSTDLGKTWTDDQQLGGGGDDQFLLRGVGYGNGRFVAAGWKILSSPDGKTWTEHKNPQSQWIGGVQWGNGRFGAAGGYGYSAYSLDGTTWMAGKGRGTEAARSLAFGMGKFVAHTDAGNWWSSTDGNNWTRGEAGHRETVVFCGTAFTDASACKGPQGHNGGRTTFGAGVWVSIRGSTIERSENGTTWTVASNGGSSLEAVAFGYAP